MTTQYEWTYNWFLSFDGVAADDTNYVINCSEAEIDCIAAREVAVCSGVEVTVHRYNNVNGVRLYRNRTGYDYATIPW